MSKRIVKKANNTKTLVTGIVMLVLSPVFFYGIGSLASLGCERSEYGDCTLDSDFQLVYTMFYLTIIYGLISLGILIYGIVLFVKSKKQKARVTKRGAIWKARHDRRG